MFPQKLRVAAVAGRTQALSSLPELLALLLLQADFPPWAFHTWLPLVWALVRLVTHSR